MEASLKTSKKKNRKIEVIVPGKYDYSGSKRNQWIKLEQEVLTRFVPTNVGGNFKDTPEEVRKKIVLVR